MSFNISDFTAQINKRKGLAKSNLFVMNIHLSSTLSSSLNVDEIASGISTSDLRFFCKTVSIPEFSINTVTVKERGYGPGSTRPIDLEYSPLTAIFMIDAEFDIKHFFHQWMQEIVNFNVEQGAESQVRNKRAYEFGYKDDYTSTLEVVTYSYNTLNTNNTYIYKFGNAYPTSIGNVDVSWENEAEIMTLPVTFAYDEFTSTGTRTGTANQTTVSGSIAVHNPFDATNPTQIA